MAVRTDELALGDLSEDRLATDPCEMTYFGDLFVTGKVIPGHCRMVKETAAVGTRVVLLELLHPFHDLAPALTPPRNEPGPGRAEVSSVIRLAARLAPRLTPLSASMEVMKGLALATTTTRLHLSSD
jgi:hypothetical protein